MWGKIDIAKGMAPVITVHKDEDAALEEALDFTGYAASGDVTTAELLPEPLHVETQTDPWFHDSLDGFDAPQCSMSPGEDMREEMFGAGSRLTRENAILPVQVDARVNKVPNSSKRGGCRDWLVNCSECCSTRTELVPPRAALGSVEVHQLDKSDAPVEAPDGGQEVGVLLPQQETKLSTLK